MKHDELEQRQEQEWQQFRTDSKAAYQAVSNRYDELERAFMDLGESLPLAIKERRRLEYDAVHTTWKTGGINWRQLKQKHTKEIKDEYRIEKFKWLLEDIRRKEDLDKSTGIER